MRRKKRISCPIRHVSAYIVTHDDGGHAVKCVNLKVCGDTCPYLKDPDYKSEFRRAPSYRAK
jgi:hypothetical protein